MGGRLVAAAWHVEGLWKSLHGLSWSMGSQQWAAARLMERGAERRWASGSAGQPVPAGQRWSVGSLSESWGILWEEEKVHFYLDEAHYLEVCLQLLRMDIFDLTVSVIADSSIFSCLVTHAWNWPFQLCYVLFATQNLNTHTLNVYVFMFFILLDLCGVSKVNHVQLNSSQSK